MKSLEEHIQYLNDEVEKLKIEGGVDSLYEPISYILSIGGKRLRPALTLMSSDMFGCAGEQALYPAIAGEVFHNFTLMHDDIMDDAPVRRGKTTVHEKWDTNQAILSGDAMLVLAYQVLTQYTSEHFKEVMECFNKTALEVCEGQQLDMEYEERDDVTVDEYLKMIHLKTSVLLAGSLRIGAIVAGVEQSEKDKIYNFGLNLGMAFQLRDDYLDAFGDAQVFGKQQGGDILSDKKTYLLIKAFEKAGKSEMKVLDQYIGNGISEPQEKLDAVLDVMRKLDVGEDLNKLTDHYFEKAIAHLNDINVSEDRKTELRNFAEMLIVREV